MAASPWARASLYRNLRLCVILGALALLPAQMARAQSAPRRPKPSKGPRALGLLELTPNGKAYLIPVVIMYDGEFYDASAYKAAPVPMALAQGNVYEAERTGVPEGLFTVGGALQGPNNTWKAQGTWLPEGAKPANAPHKAETKPRDIDPEEGPPVLHRSSEKTKPVEAEPEPTPPAAGPSTTPAPVPAASAPAAPPPPAPPPAEPDRNQPVLRRGKPAPAPPELLSPRVAASAKAAAEQPPAGAKSAAPAIQMIPAISDAAGPEPRPYSFLMKPAEEEQLRKKILAMAADLVRARAQQLASSMVGASSPGSAAQRRKASPPSKPPGPEFDDVQLHVFDLSFSNEPVLVLTAKARMPQRSNAGAPEVQYLLTLVARQDIYGELHKAFSNITDTQHLDVLPRMDLIDAVDVDGDGRGELLFRRTSDAGSAFSVYRVIGDQLWPLFEGTLGE